MSVPPLVARRPGFTLERHYYTSPETFETDIRRIFFTQWLYAGHESQLKKPGDFFTSELAGENVVIVRIADGELAAFLNVCRHRGARLVQGICGHVPAFRCPYHNWTYALNGCLKVAPGMMDYISKEEYALFRVWVESWQGFIYINLAPAQPVTSVADMLTAAGPVLQRFRLEHAKIVKTIVYDVPANWKLFMENYRECYHCLSNHPQFCGTVPVGRTSLYRAVSDSRVIQAANLTFSRYPLRPGARTPSISGELVSMPFGEVAVADQGFLYALNFYPGHALAFGIDHGMAFSLHPQSATQSLLKVDWYVSDEAVEGKDYDVADVIAFWDATHRQDIELCAINQQGVNSRRYVPGPYSPNEEDEINHLLNFYVNALAAGE